jgi:hypothetical protein
VKTRLAVLYVAWAAIVCLAFLLGMAVGALVAVFTMI